MYLKLGNTNIKYLSNHDDFMILSEVIDSKMSYEKPVLVRTMDELDIWFGQDFENYEYMLELLKSGITLYLYKPINVELSKDIDDFIDYYSFIEDPTFYYFESQLPETGEENVKYKLREDQGLEFDDVLGLKFDYVIWYQQNYVNVKDLPQNLGDVNSISLNNRDTLRINNNQRVGRTYPKYLYKSSTDIVYDEEVDFITLDQNLPDIDRIDLGYESLALDLNFSEDVVFDNSYLIISELGRKNVLIWFKSTEQSVIPTIDNNYYQRSISIDIEGISNKELIITEVLNTLNSLGYKIIKNSPNNYTIYLSSVIDVNYFYDWKGFNYLPNIEVTQNILSKLTDSDKIIEFYSKTIGGNSINRKEEELINIVSERLSNNEIRLTLSRFNYSEVFEGLDLEVVNAINLQSKLVSCRKFDISTSIPEGFWKLSRSYSETYDSISFLKGLDAIFNDGETIYFDYLLVPEISKYTNGLSSDYNYYKEYELILDYSKLIGCQVLIQNSDNGWDYVNTDELDLENLQPIESTVYIVKKGDEIVKYMAIVNNIFQEISNPELINENNYIFNYTDDLENRLIYFYKSMTVNGNLRPGYYAYLLGLFNDTYSIETKSINYDSPVSNPYDDVESIEKELSKYKSNYLVDNNHVYYYKNYQNGTNFISSGWMRFCLGKISRELEKNKWEYISHRIVSDIVNNITQVLNRVSDKFSIIRTISISDYTIDFLNGKIKLTIETNMSDLVDNNISLDITLNYNN